MCIYVYMCVCIYIYMYFLNYNILNGADMEKNMKD